MAENRNIEIASSEAENELVRTGSRVRVGYLLQQAAYTFALAREHGEAMAGILPAGYLDAAEALRSEVEASVRDRTAAHMESVGATHVQNNSLKRCQEWRRRVSALGKIAAQSGLRVPDEIRKVGKSTRTVPAALQSLQRGMSTLEEYRKDLSSFPLFEEVMKEGGALSQELSQADATQEAMRLDGLPEAVRKYCAAKGRLFAAVKIVSEAGRAAFAGKRAVARRFNLSIVRRRRSKAADPEVANGGSDSSNSERPAA